MSNWIRFGIIMILALSQVNVQQAVHQRYRLLQQEKQLTEQYTAESQRLLAMQATLTAGKNIEQEATKKLHMHLPSASEIQMVDLP